MFAGTLLRAFPRSARSFGVLTLAKNNNGQIVSQLKRTISSPVKNARSAQLIVKALSTESNNPNVAIDSALDHVTYERVCSETLDALCDYFEELTENATNLTSSDVTYGDGVLTVNLGKDNGIYVINRQTPNKQIWLSSPTSGPKRFDFVGTKDAHDGRWIYKHTGESLHELLQHEMQSILKVSSTVDFLQLPYGR